MEVTPQTEAAPESLLAQANLARIRGQWSEAVEICVRVLRGHPGSVNAHSLLGDIYRDQGAIDDAIQWYRMAADLQPDGPDSVKLRKLEAQREQHAAQSAPLTASALATYESGAGGTTQLMGYSPRRWLNVLTIVSACFLAATVIVLASLRMNPPNRGATLPRPMQLSSHPLMPTADTVVPLPPIDPNRPAVMPLGETPREPGKVHQTGAGLEPDRPNNSRTAPLPTFSPQTGPDTQAAPRTPSVSHEIPPAPVQTIRPIDSTLTVAPEDTRPGEDRQAADPARAPEANPAGHAGDGQPDTQAGADSSTGTNKPAPDNGAGEQKSNGGDASPEP